MEYGPAAVGLPGVLVAVLILLVVAPQLILVAVPIAMFIGWRRPRGHRFDTFVSEMLK